MDNNHPLQHVELQAQDEPGTIEALQARIAQLESDLVDMTARKDVAYEERNHVVAALARAFPSGIRKTDIPDWHASWHNCVYIDLPTGQISYHYHDSQAHLFSDLPAYTKPYDGHVKLTVHQRLTTLEFGPDFRYLDQYIKDHREIVRMAPVELRQYELDGITLWCDKLEKFALGVRMAHEAGVHPSEFWHSQEHRA